MYIRNFKKTPKLIKKTITTFFTRPLTWERIARINIQSKIRTWLKNLVHLISISAITKNMKFMIINQKITRKWWTPVSRNKSDYKPTSIQDSTGSGNPKHKMQWKKSKMTDHICKSSESQLDEALKWQKISRVYSIYLNKFNWSHFHHLNEKAISFL